MTWERWQSAEEVEAYRAERKRVSENYFNRAHSLAAWLLATLVAVNGAAVLGIMGRDPPVPAGLVTAAIPFTLGIILALVSGLSSWNEAQDKNSLYYIQSLREDQLEPIAQRLKRRYSWRAPVFKFLAITTNYLAMAAFVIGCWMALEALR